MTQDWRGPKGNMRLDGGYNGSVQQAIANLQIGRDQGRQQGRSEGFEQGRQHGYSEGWHAGVASANKTLDPLRSNVRQYFAEAVQLRANVAQSQALIDLIVQQLSTVAANEKAWKASERALNDELAALRNSLELKTMAFEALDRIYQHTYPQLRLQNHRVRRLMMLTGAAQALLQEMVADGSPIAQQVRSRFAIHYEAAVTACQQRGDLSCRPEQDEVFREHLPDALQFIQAMLQTPAETD